MILFPGHGFRERQFFYVTTSFTVRTRQFFPVTISRDAVAYCFDSGRAKPGSGHFFKIFLARIPPGRRRLFYLLLSVTGAATGCLHGPGKPSINRDLPAPAMRIRLTASAGKLTCFYIVNVNTFTYVPSNE
jgi:hypothetical protein